MSVRNLEFLFRPSSIAVIGASQENNTIGFTVMRNLLAGGFNGPILPVSSQWETVGGVLAYADVAALPLTPELAIICRPLEEVPQLISSLGEIGTRAVMILSDGFDTPDSNTNRELRDAALQAARPFLIRVLGPNSVGFLAPHIRLNAGFAPSDAKPGKMAFISQSSGLATSVLDWADSRGIGFSHFISLGQGWDVDFGDVLDYLGGDPNTHAILLYIETLDRARKFMSAARAAARNKPVIVVRSGRYEDSAGVAASHTGALAGTDDVYDAAIQRAGMLRVDTVEELFNAAELLGRGIRVRGNRLALVSNGGGIGVLAADALGRHGARLSPFAPETKAALEEVLPGDWPKVNPLDLAGDASIERYLACFDILVKAREIDAILLLHVPSALVDGEALAQELAPKLRKYRIPVLSCWLGGELAHNAEAEFFQAGIPTFKTPEEAVNAFMQLVAYQQNQSLLSETPETVQLDDQVDQDGARRIIADARSSGRSVLSEPEAKALLSCYGIPTVETRVVQSDEEALSAAEELGYPVVAKIVAHGVPHKSHVGGVSLELEDAVQLLKALSAMKEKLQQKAPAAIFEGFTIQPMIRPATAQELILGAKTDPVFGPVLLFGQGGTAVELMQDRAIALPPLNMALARQMVDRTRVGSLLKGYGGLPGVNLDVVYTSIVKLSQLVIDLRDVEELDINPLLADERGVLALDAHISLLPEEVVTARVGTRLSIRPYPSELEEDIDLKGIPVHIRPIRPEDEGQHLGFLENLEPEDVYFRFFGMIRRFEHSQLARLTQIDFDREMAFIAVRDDADGQPQTVGEVRVAIHPDKQVAEFAIIVSSAIKGRGLGAILMNKMIDYCRSRGIATIQGQVLQENMRMLALTRKIGFVAKASDEQGVLLVELDLKKKS